MFICASLEAYELIQIAQFFAGQFTVGAGGKIPESHRTDCYAREINDGITQILKESAHNPIPAFVNGQLYDCGISAAITNHARCCRNSDSIDFDSPQDPRRDS
jgi:hypothetical protein